MYFISRHTRTARRQTMNAQKILESKVSNALGDMVARLFDELFNDLDLADDVSNADLVAEIQRQVADTRDMIELVIIASCE